MYTSNDHILVYLQAIDAKGYTAVDMLDSDQKTLNHIRVVPVSHSSLFFDELQKVYGEQCSLTDDNFYMFYNCGDLYHRLVNDLKFKKFRDIDKFVSVSEGMWLTVSSKEPSSWYHNGFVPWIRSRMMTYIEDLGEGTMSESIFNKLTLYDWTKLPIEKYARLFYDEQDTMSYQLLNTESTKDNSIILTENHILSLIAVYANVNFGRILCNEDFTKKSEPNANPILISDADNIRGIKMSTDTLTHADMSDFFKILQIPECMLGSIITSKNFSKMQDDTLNSQSNFLASEFTLFGRQYAFLDDTTMNVSQGDIETIFQPLQLFSESEFMRSRQPQLDGLRDVATAFNGNEVIYTTNLTNYPKPVVYSLESPVLEKQETHKEVVFYKNLLNSSVRSFAKVTTDFPRTLKEFEKISNFSYKSSMTNSIIDLMNNNSVTSEFVNELLELVTILTGHKNSAHLPEDETDGSSTPDFTFLQRALTQTYVEKYKNNALETLASAVIDNVYNYLRESSLDEKHINKNQIGKDLVDLGVKKTRKSKGYVYGVEDTKHKENNSTSQTGHMFEIDHSKVEKMNHQLRTQTLQREMKFTTMNVDPLLFSVNTPASFLVPNKRMEMGFV